MSERWLPVAGFEDLYEVSDRGRVRSVERVVAKIDGRVHRYPSKIKAAGALNGYPRVVLYRGNVGTHAYVHRLVASAFIPNPSDLPCVNHKNGVKCDARVENLEWVTHAQNIQHGYDTGLTKALFGEDASRAKASRAAVEKLRADVEAVVTAFCAEHDVCAQTAWDIISRKTWARAA